jgi:superfamily I DNA/RNA helicase
VARLAIAKGFLAEYAKLDSDVKSAVDMAIAKLAKDPDPKLCLEKPLYSRDHRIRILRVDDHWCGIVLAPAADGTYCLVTVLPRDTAAAYATSRRFSVNRALGVLETRDEEAIQQLHLSLQEAGEPDGKRLFADISRADLTWLGIDAQVLPTVRLLASEIDLEALQTALPEAQYAALQALACGMTVNEARDEIARLHSAGTSPERVDPDDLVSAMERTPGEVTFVPGQEELQFILAHSFAAWRTFLHPSQRKVAYRESYSGPAQVTGGPGTGKTVTVLHRAAFLAARVVTPPSAAGSGAAGRLSQPGPGTERVLVTTVNGNLANTLHAQLDLLVRDADVRRRIEVLNVDRLAYRIVKEARASPLIADERVLRTWWAAATAASGLAFTPAFLKNEWEQVILAQDLHTEQAYLTCLRIGRGRPLTKTQRSQIWRAVQQVTAELAAARQSTHLQLANEATQLLQQAGVARYRHILVDEGQDLHPSQWRLLRAAVASGPDDLFIAADPHQRIYDNRVSLGSLGISVRGRSWRLSLNYRTTQEILAWAVPLLGADPVVGLDGEVDSLLGYRSPMHGPLPEQRMAAIRDEEFGFLAERIRSWVKTGIEPQAIGLAARSASLVREAREALKDYGIETVSLSGRSSKDAVRAGTMHAMKGLEFQAVAVIGVEGGLVPEPAAVTPENEDAVAHVQDLQRERCLLFVACTRARDHLYISGTGEQSRFLPPREADPPLSSNGFAPAAAGEPVGEGIAVDSAAGSGGNLGVLHERLARHFRGLRARRDQAGLGIPLFALEHGLSQAELCLLEAEVRSAVRDRDFKGAAWLPLVVYAAEIGYNYAGEEYWQTFASSTPGWAESGDRQYIRKIFQDFSNSFGGAEPVGAWATWFSNISWPITHAVLPTDLQRQLAKLLFDYRTALTSELLADPSELGMKLAARAWHYSSRFQNFAQNASLLGQVAAALLKGDDEESPYLLESTLKRIVESLSAERVARQWLEDAKWTVSRVRTRGFRPPPVRRINEVAERERLPSATDPAIFLREERHGWTAYLDLPDLSVLAERLPGIHEELGRLRARVAGAAGPLARGRLLVTGQQIRFVTWPDPQAALIQIEGASPQSNSILADQCVLSPGPRWVFRVREPGLATEVKGKFVCPGHSYILICREALEPGNLPGWVTRVDSGTSGIHAYYVEVPAPADSSQFETLRFLGVGVQADVAIRPAGLVPAAWDGEGAADWIAGEDVAVAVTTTRKIAKCIFQVDGVPQLLGWPDGQDEIFVTLSGLQVGTHEACISLLPADIEEPVARGTLILTVRAPHSRPPGGTLREGLVLLPSPAAPSLPELWDGRAALQILGPPGVRAQVEIALADKTTILAGQRFKAPLPVDLPTWRKIAATQLRGAPHLRGAYDDAESCEVTVSYPGLGTVRLRCEREFAPLRWVIGNGHDGPFARLIDNTGDTEPIVECFEFSAPANPIRVSMSADARLRWAAGGLLRATAGGFEASVILAPTVRNLGDLQLADVIPQLAPASRTATEIQQLIRLAALWSSAALPANPLAQYERRSVLRAVPSRLASLIGGGYWERLEQHASTEALPKGAMQAGVGVAPYQRALAASIASSLTAWKAVTPEKRAPGFGAILNGYVPQAELGHDYAKIGELLLRLASEPASLMAWPHQDVAVAVDKMLVTPVILRAARFTVLAIHSATTEDTMSTYRGWEWT